MTSESQPPSKEQMRSVIQTHHPQIADEIEGAIKTLRKLKDFAAPDGSVASLPDQNDQGPATIAMTAAFKAGPSGAAAGDTLAYAATQAEPSGGDDIPVLKASSTFGRYQIIRLLGRG